ncbi:MAG TPA: hypothetical protein PKV78_12790, partial [Methanoculleus thermophilus]|nr:hypothetical protein [Methanoculleus thermophilus]
MEIALDLEDIGASSEQKYIDVTTVQNGIFTTKDEVAPKIEITTGETVSSTFNIAGTITEVGGMEKNAPAKATLTNKTATCSYDLPLNEINSTTYSFSKQVTWPVENGVTLTVTAIDAAGNKGTETATIDVVAAGFSDPLPAPGSYINEIPESASVIITEMKTKTITMCLGNATHEKNLDVNATIKDSCAKGKLPCDLADGEYWVNVSGIDNYENPQSLNWTFTLDTNAPVINTFTITDSDGDGYIEAGEELTLNWKVTDPNFEHVALVDTETDDELWCCDSSTSSTGTEKVVIDVGNRDLEFRAYDLACNSDSCAFHLYNNYMIWVNSTKVGEVSGIDTTYTAAKDLSRTDVSSITLHNACNVPRPSVSELKRTVTGLGWVTSDTYVTADKDANRTLEGSETYQNAWVYDPNKTFDFTVKVPNTQKAVLVLAEANESYIAELIDGGKSSIKSVDYMDLVQKTAYIFIDGGWTKVTMDDEGKVQQDHSSGKAITTPADLSATGVLSHPDNQVDLHNGYRLSAQKYQDKCLEPIILPPGDYTLAAVTVDGDRIGLLASMPVIVLESNDQGSISPANVKKEGEFTAGFTTDCERLGVILLRDTTYEGTAYIDAAKLGKDTIKQTLKLNITHNGIPATQKLVGDVYVSPNSGKYVVANTKQTTVSTSGLDAGTYLVYLVAQSANGTVQAYGMHTLEITSDEVTPEPTTPTPYTPGRSGGGGGGGGGSSYTS